MAGFADRLAGIKAKQETKVAEKSAAEAAERAAREKETKKGELQEQRVKVAEEFEGAQKMAQEGENAVAEADAFANEQGADLDPEVKAEIDALKAEVGEATKKFGELQARIQEIDAEIAALEAGGVETVTEEAMVETPAEAALEIATEAPVEAPIEAVPVEAVPEAVPTEAPTEAPAEAGTAKAISETVSEKPAEAPIESAQKVPAEAIPDIGSMDFDAATKVMEGAFKAPKEIIDWYDKMLSGTGTIPDVAFANKQIDKLKTMQDRLDKLGPTYVEMRKKAGKKTENLEKMLTEIEDDLGQLINKIQDRIMLASPEVDDEEILKNIHLETIEEDLDEDKHFNSYDELNRRNRNLDHLDSETNYQLVDSMGKEVADFKDKLVFLDKVGLAAPKGSERRKLLGKIKEKAMRIYDRHEEKWQRLDNLKAAEMKWRR